MADLKGQLQSVVSDLSHMKSTMMSFGKEGKPSKKAIPREISVRY